MTRDRSAERHIKVTAEGEKGRGARCERTAGLTIKQITEALQASDREKTGKGTGVRE